MCIHTMSCTLGCWGGSTGISIGVRVYTDSASYCIMGGPDVSRSLWTICTYLATLNKTLASANNMLAFIIYLKPLSLLYSSSPFIYLRSLVSNHWNCPFALLSSVSAAPCVVDGRWNIVRIAPDFNRLLFFIPN